MSEEPETKPLQALIPKNLDDIIRANRDQCRLAFATDEELNELEREPPGSVASSVRHTLKEWNILIIHAVVNGSVQSIPTLLGNVQETGQCWITSTVTAVDSQAGLIRTKNSVYRVVGPRSAEPDMHLLMHVCVWLNQQGVGRHFGVPGFFY
jgi:hypothetical protein